MDVRLPKSNRRRNRRIATATAIGVAFFLLTLTAWRFSQRPPGVSGDQIFLEEVRHGEFLFSVKGLGSIYAPHIRSITNRSEGVVEQIFVLPGHVVGPHDALLELSNLNLLQELADAEAELESAQANEELRLVNAAEDYLDLESALADMTAVYEEARITADAELALMQENATTTLTMTSAVNQADQARRRMDIAQTKLDNYPEKLALEYAQAQSSLQQLRRNLTRLADRVRNLQVTPNFVGVVQEVSVEAGQRIGDGTEVARVVNTDHLIARLWISQRDAALVRMGQTVELQIGRDKIHGEVERIDPTVTDQRVSVDVALVGDHYQILRPDLTVSGVIEIERVPDALFVTRPQHVRDEHRTAELFRLSEDGTRAELVSVEIGLLSPTEMVISNGLEAGDRIIGSNMSDWLEEPVLRIR